MIPSQDTLPEDPADWQHVRISLPRLPKNSPPTSPPSVREIMDYVRVESADLDEANAKRLKFVRTAQIERSRYWLWTYTESDGEMCYVFFRKRGSRDTHLSLTSTENLTP